MLNTCKLLWKRWQHWCLYRNYPVIRIDLDDTEQVEAFVRIYRESKEEHGEEGIFLESLCKHYRCKFRVETATACVLVFKDENMYTMFILKYGHLL